jgi:hypothetical protein
MTGSARWTVSPRGAVAMLAGLILAALAVACNDLASGPANRFGRVADSFGIATRAGAPLMRRSVRDEARPATAPLAEAKADLSQTTREEGLAGGLFAGGDRLPDDAATGSLMIVRTGTASIEVHAIDSAVARVRLLATQVGGYVANSALQGGPDQVRTATIEIKTPAQDFDRLLAGLAPIGHLEAVNVTAEDVGEEYVDVGARMANDHRLEERLLQLLGTRTGKLKDVLDVERELARVREEIERYEGRLRFLRAHAAVSTLSVTIHEPLPVLQQPGTSPIGDATRQAWRNFVGLIALVIASTGVLVPLGALGAAAWWLRRRTHQPPAAPASP